MARTRSNQAVGALVVGVLAAGISLLRLWLGNSRAITETLWAEDGLFPLCIHKADFVTCVSDPFAGYLLFLPRVLAWPVSITPWESWALVANVIAATLAGLLAALVLVIARGSHLGWFVSVAIALLPVITPMAGLEALNSIGSSYMLLLFAATLAVLFRPDRGPGWTAVVALLLLVTALTIPSTVVVLMVLGVQLLRGAVRKKTGLVWGTALVIGLAAQAAVALTATTRRPLQLTGESLNAWADSVPTSILTYWPGLSLGEYSFFTNFTLAPLPGTGWVIVALILVLGVWRLILGWRRRETNNSSIGLLLLSGLALGLIPSAIGYANNRYFVVPLLLWGAAGLVWLDPVIRRTRPWVLAGVTALVAVVWWPAIPASEYRSTPAPEWTAEVARVEAKCLAAPAFVDRPIFSPFWPPNWGDGLNEPTHPNLPCTTVFRWLP